MTQEQFMTVKELAEVSGCHPHTVRSAIKRVLPYKGINMGQRIRLNQFESIEVMKALPKKNIVSVK